MTDDKKYALRFRNKLRALLAPVANRLDCRLHVSVDSASPRSIYFEVHLSPKRPPGGLAAEITFYVRDATFPVVDRLAEVVDEGIKEMRSRKK
jgi:hypothetical protein